MHRVIGEQVKVNTITTIVQHVEWCQLRHSLQHAQVVLDAEAAILVLAQRIGPRPASRGEKDPTSAVLQAGPRIRAECLSDCVERRAQRIWVVCYRLFDGLLAIADEIL